MYGGILLAAAVLFAGGVIYMAQNTGRAPGDHVFRGEPHWLRDPVAIARDALEANDRAFLQLGVLLLLANPVLRVVFLGIGFAAQRDRLYTVVSLLVLAVLAVSFWY